LLDLLDFTEANPVVHGYQPRIHSVYVEESSKPRHCRCCNEKIPKHTNHLIVEGYLSSGRRSNSPICKDCVKMLSVKLRELHHQKHS
jgi:hypothetical protein